jgi:hypothetical protein
MDQKRLASRFSFFHSMIGIRGRTAWAVTILLAWMIFPSWAPAAPAESVIVDPDRAVIEIPAGADAAQKEAAGELRHHLKLITGIDIDSRVQGTSTRPSGFFTFYVGIAPPGTNKALAPEETRWVVTPAAAYLYGDPHPGRGDLYAVYGFLENQLNVHWVEPGEFGIVYTPSKTLALKTGEFNWIPRLQARIYRSAILNGQYPTVTDSMRPFAEFLPSHKLHDQWAADIKQWQARMRMGSHSTIRYGHAFTRWWDQYHQTHPEYFGLNKWGRRVPELPTSPSGEPAFTQSQTTQVKLCVSNPAVAEQIVQNWLAEGKRTGKLAKWVDVCMNDGLMGFCTCANCRALDATPPGENWRDHLSDRYVHLADEVARRVRKYDPGAGAVMYAYESTLQPPIKTRVEPNVAVVIVPVSINPSKVTALFEGWKKAGATTLMTRPNYPHYYEKLGLSYGFEKQMYDAFQTALKNGAVGADYDSLLGFWRYHGLTDYVLARTFYDPSRPLSDWEAEYYSAYGPAADEVAQYYHYWRNNVWEKRVLPHLDQIVTEGKYHNFARGLLWSLQSYYRADDFDKTDAILARAAQRPLSPMQQQRLEELTIANRNARMTFDAVTAKGRSKLQHSQALLKFRQKYKNDSHFAWFRMMDAEIYFGDLAGLKAAEQSQQH